MIARRPIAAAAAISTVLVVQATILTPVTAPLAASLPAVLVAAIGIELGVSAGLSVGFSAGLLADLGSQHPAGVLAIAWLLLGAGCGLLAEPGRRATRSLLVVSLAAGVAGLVSAIALARLDAPSASLSTILGLALPTTLADAVLALLVVPCVRAVLRALRVRVPRTAPRSSASRAVPAGRIAIDG